MRPALWRILFQFVGIAGAVWLAWTIPGALSLAQFLAVMMIATSSFWLGLYSEK